jgi:hypothetical protein
MTTDPFHPGLIPDSGLVPDSGLIPDSGLVPDSGLKFYPGYEKTLKAIFF